MPKELFWLTLTTVLTGVLWLPYILDRIVVRGLMGAMANPRPDAAPQSPWADRLMRVHDNAIENLVIFAVLVLTAHALGIANAITAFACVLYFWARLAHVVVFTLGIPVLRTLSFAGGVIAQGLLVLTIFKLI